MNEESAINIDPVLEAVADCLGSTVSDFDRLRSGNSQVFRLRCQDGRHVLAKAYPDPSVDGRDRLKTEYRALSFLWENGVRDIPEPIGCDTDRRVGVYAFVDGEPTDPVNEEDVDNASRFLARLSTLRDVAQDADLAPASEACFDGPEYIASVSRRFAMFKDVEMTTPFHEEAIQLVRNVLDPLFDQIRSLMVGCSVSPGERTLSPSDFGFHNSIRTPDGTIVYVDFEYFGWDDPAKMISDFLLHPGHVLPNSGPSRFLRTLRPVFGDERVVERLRCVYPLLALKWCFILMNEFLPESGERRRRATGIESDDTWQAEVLPRQLIKARRMVDRTKDALQSGFQIGEVFS